MATVHAAQALFLAQQMVSCAAGFGFTTAYQASTIPCVTICVSIVWHFKAQDIKSNHKWTSIHQSFSAKLPTVLIHQSILPPKFFTVW